MGFINVILIKLGLKKKKHVDPDIENWAAKMRSRDSYRRRDTNQNSIVTAHMRFSAVDPNRSSKISSNGSRMVIRHNTVNGTGGGIAQVGHFFG